MKPFTAIIIFCWIISSCTQERNETIANLEDYEKYLHVNQEREIQSLEQELSFWKEKIKQRPNGFTYYQKLGSSYLGLFESTGKIDYLHLANESFHKAESLTFGSLKKGSLLTLSSLAIKKHDFESAANFAVKAKSVSEEKMGPLLMQFDAEMELGNFQSAREILKQNQRRDSFDYLVRLSKFKDFEGDLDSAIFFMEKAEELVRREQSKRKIWSKANLADMYGHAGRIEGSYHKYLEVLSIDSTYSYALKGIAWIVYSADHNALESMRILEAIYKRTAMPDLLLDMAELHEYNGRSDLAEQLKADFLEKALREEYYPMYNKYLIEIFLEQGNVSMALELAQEEVAARPTPNSYDWLARVYAQMGDVKRAISLYNEHVEGKTHEPEPNLHMGLTYYRSGQQGGERLLRECLESSFELGPIWTNTIEETLKSKKIALSEIQ